MRKKIIIPSLLIAISATNVLANSVSPQHPIKFKNDISSSINIKRNQPLITTNKLPSISDYTNYVLNKTNLLPEIGYKAPKEVPTPNDYKEFSSNKPNKGLKDTGIKYNADYSTNDLVYTGYTFNSGLIFPIDLRQDRNAGITTGIKSKSKNHNGLTLTSTVGYRSLGSLEWHTGLDISGGIGENGVKSQHNLYAPINAKVLYAGVGESGSGVGGYGNSVVLEFKIGNITYRSHFAHMSYINPKLVVGQTVKQGQYLGRIGSTGKSTGTHLHWNLSLANSYTSSFGFPQPYKKKFWSYSNVWESYGKNYAIVDPTYIYGNTGTGQPYTEFFDKLGIKNFSGTASKELNQKSSYYQAPYNYSGKNSQTVPIPYNAKGIVKPNGKG